jgi:RNA polymerase sigma-70 factor (ECF subfamily)
MTPATPKSATTTEPEEREQTLARLVRNGDRAAFERVMRLHNRRLFRLARATLRDDAEAEDALQEAYIHAYRNIGSFRGDATLATWLSRIVLNQCLGRLRRALRRERIVPIVGWTADLESEIMNVPDDDGPDKALIQAQTRALLERKLDALPVAFRTVFVMRCVEELSVEETAACLGIPEATVRSRHFRARGLLRESLAQEFDLAERAMFSFDGARCDRVVAKVLALLAS